MNEIVEELLQHLDGTQREIWEERAGIMQYDGGLTRDHAECLALLYLLRQSKHLIRNTIPKGGNGDE